jgi:hypothetical protein
MKRIILIGCLWALSGCTAIANWADNMGQHMPVVGERCEHWQCLTSSGQAKSNEYKMNRQYNDATPPAEADEEPAEDKRFPSPPR